MRQDRRDRFSRILDKKIENGLKIDRLIKRTRNLVIEKGWSPLLAIKKQNIKISITEWAILCDRHHELNEVRLIHNFRMRDKLIDKSGRTND